MHERTVPEQPTSRFRRWLIGIGLVPPPKKASRHFSENASLELVPSDPAANRLNSLTQNGTPYHLSPHAIISKYLGQMYMHTSARQGRER